MVSIRQSSRQPRERQRLHAGSSAEPHRGAIDNPPASRAYFNGAPRFVTQVKIQLALVLGYAQGDWLFR